MPKYKNRINCDGYTTWYILAIISYKAARNYFRLLRHWAINYLHATSSPLPFYLQIAETNTTRRAWGRSGCESILRGEVTMFHWGGARHIHNVFDSFFLEELEVIEDVYILFA